MHWLKFPMTFYTGILIIAFVCNAKSFAIACIVFSFFSALFQKRTDKSFLAYLPYVLHSMSCIY